MTRRIPELDGLRAIAVLIVLLWHYVGLLAGGALYTFFRPGRTGVDLFFVLSGFLITSILIENRGARNYYSVFYLRRAARILPVYFACLAVFILGRQSGQYASMFGGKFEVWTYTVFLQNFEMARLNSYGPYFMSGTWSLAVEEHFYLVFPALIAAVPLRHLPKVLIAIIATAIPLRIAAHGLWGHMAAYTLMPCRADTLAIGALVAWSFNDQAARQWLQQNRQLATRVCLAVMATGPIHWMVPSHSFGSHMAIWGYGHLAVFYGAVLLAVLLYQGSPRLGVLRSRPASAVAAISYALYMVHGVVLLAVLNAGGYERALVDLWSWLLVGIAAILSVALSAMSYVWLERPFLRWGHSLRYDRTEPNRSGWSWRPSAPH